MPADRAATRRFQVRRVLLREVVRAWRHLALTDEARTEFMNFKDLPGWSFVDAYDQRASVDEAEIITWA
mgnify:CR=1 FL=1